MDSAARHFWRGERAALRAECYWNTSARAPCGTELPRCVITAVVTSKVSGRAAAPVLVWAHDGRWISAASATDCGLAASCKLRVWRCESDPSCTQGPTPSGLPFTPACTRPPRPGVRRALAAGGSAYLQADLMRPSPCSRSHRHLRSLLRSHLHAPVLAPACCCAPAARLQVCAASKSELGNENQAVGVPGAWWLSLNRPMWLRRWRGRAGSSTLPGAGLKPRRQTSVPARDTRKKAPVYPVVCVGERLDATRVALTCRRQPASQPACGPQRCTPLVPWIIDMISPQVTNALGPVPKWQQTAVAVRPDRPGSLRLGLV